LAVPSAPFAPEQAKEREGLTEQQFIVRVRAKTPKANVLDMFNEVEYFVF
jgi:hypothetical protein